jgi:hypothetical protein
MVCGAVYDTYDEAANCKHPTQRIIELILNECARQGAKWGDDRKQGDMVWLTILMEEVGESAEAILKGLPVQTEIEVIHVAAVAVSWLKCIAQREGD